MKCPGVNRKKLIDNYSPRGMIGSEVIAMQANAIFMPLIMRFQMMRRRGWSEIARSLEIAMRLMSKPIS
jgi:hypothetical protein